MKTKNASALTDLPIGALARVADVNVETIRYYQRVMFIKRAQGLGFSLEEVKALLRLEDGQSCAETRALAEHKLAIIEDRLADLSRMRRLLKSLISECSAGKRPRSCPIIATLSARA